MSVDTRTPRTPTGDRSSGFDDAPALSMVKVPSDPAQVIVNHASFRVQLGAPARKQSPRIARHFSSTGDAARFPAVGTAGRAGSAAGGRRRAPVVWSGRSAPDDTGAHRLLQAVRGSSVGPVDAGATQVIPRVGEHPGYAADMGVDTVETPIVGSQRTPEASETRLLPRMRTVGSAYDEPPYADDQFDEYEYEYEDELDEADDEDEDQDERRGSRAASGASSGSVRHAYYPGRRMNLGVVLLPLRVFLGFISIYAGMGKLCDPVYFDGGKRGSMVKWLNTLHPWEVAEPLRQFALQHPVGAGLVIAFFQVIVGVLTVLGLWQRVAAVVGAMLSAALIVTVSWKTVPAYDAPDIIYLAAWSPLIIAGAPVYSVDGRLSGEAWRTLGPRAELGELRRRVLRRGALVSTVVVGLTLLIGSLLGGAVRDAGRVVVPGPGEAPRNELPGSPLPETPGERHHKASPSASSEAPTQGSSSSPSGAAATTPGATRGSGTVTSGPSQTQGTGQAPPQQSAPVDQAPSTSAGPTSGGGTASGGTTGGSTGGGSGSGGGSSSGGQPGLVGGLLG
ncbi:DoxX family protein [Streptomyces sp. Tue6028]|uniref:DoxX family protein n=1 Tax=Streptomyces sp. Tue6028 TaxID=2036037 RepID=UPI0015CA17A9|nr:DoxX family protein [Streptomyces sp. Tue6028]